MSGVVPRKVFHNFPHYKIGMGSDSSAMGTDHSTLSCTLSGLYELPDKGELFRALLGRHTDQKTSHWVFAE